MKEELISKKEDSSSELIHYYMVLPKQIKGSAAELKPANLNEATSNLVLEVPQGLSRGVTIVSGKLNIPVFNVVN